MAITQMVIAWVADLLDFDPDYQRAVHASEDGVVDVMDGSACQKRFVVQGCKFAANTSKNEFEILKISSRPRRIFGNYPE